VQFKFYFYSNLQWRRCRLVLDGGGCDWCLPIGQPEGFENGLGDWAADRATGSPAANRWPRARHSRRSVRRCRAQWQYPNESGLFAHQSVAVVASPARIRGLRFCTGFQLTPPATAGNPATTPPFMCDGNQRSQEAISADYYWNAMVSRLAGFEQIRRAARAVQVLLLLQLSGGGAGCSLMRWRCDWCLQLANPKGFENGLGDWAADRGKLASWPANRWPGAPTARSVRRCRAQWSYPNEVASSLISP